MKTQILRKRLHAGIVALVVAVFISALSCGTTEDDVPLIFAAASLTDVLEEAADAYEAHTGRMVEFNLGGSNALVSHIQATAPADGVILAGNTPVSRLIVNGYVDSDNVRVVARNSLVVVSRKGNVPDSLNTLAAGRGRIAIADPALAPAGEYAQEALMAAGLWAELEQRVIPSLDVRAALGAVISGNADYAIVYATDALTEPGLEIAIPVSKQLHTPITYPAAAISGSDSADSVNDFLLFLLGDEGREIFTRHGFSDN